MTAYWSKGTIDSIRCRIFVFLFAYQKYKDKENYYFACYFALLWNLAVHAEGGTYVRMYDNRVLRRIFRRATDDLTREWMKLRNEELNDLYCSSNIWVIKPRRMRWAGHVGRMGEKRGLYRVLVGKLEGKRPLGRTRLRRRIILICRSHHNHQFS